MSAAKATWGGRLTPYPRLERLTVKTMAKQILFKMRQGLKKPPEQKLKESSAAKSTPERERNKCFVSSFQGAVPPSGGTY